MTERDLTRVMTEHVAEVYLPDGVVRSIRMAAKEEKPVKKRMSLAIAVVMMLVLLAGTAVAAGMGVLDYLREWMSDAALLPGAEELVVQNPGQCETEHAIFTIREAVSDGRGVSVMVEAEPKEAAMLLIPDVVSGDYIKYGTDMTYAAYAEANGYERLIHVSCRPEPVAGSNSYIEEADGKITMIINFSAENGVDSLSLRCTTSDGTYSREQDAVISFTLSEAALLWEVSRELNVDLPEFGVRVDRIHLACTPLALHAEVEWTALENCAEFVWFDLADEQGMVLPFNPVVVSAVKWQDDARECRVICCQPMETMPSLLTLLVGTEEEQQTIPITLP